MTAALAPNELCRAFAKDVKDRGWCKISSREYNSIRLKNRFDGSVEPVERLGELLRDWLKANKHELDDDGETWKKLHSYGLRSLRTVSGDVFMPNKPAIFVHPESKNSYINTHRKYEPKTDRKDDIEPFLSLLKDRLFRDAQDYAYCAGWMAHMVQRPEERPSWHMLFANSDSGVGKGFLVGAILDPLLMKQTSVVRSYATVSGQFSQLLKKNLLVLLDDPGTARAGTATRFKSILSEERAFVEGKGVEGGMVDTFTRFILASNEFNPVGHDDNERRWYVPKPMRHLHSPKETAEFIDSVAKWLDTDPTALDRIYNWFMAYPLGDFNPKHVQQSETLLAMIGASKDPLDDFYAAFVAVNKVFRHSELVQAIKDGGYVRPTDPAIAASLTALGWEKRLFFFGGKRSPYYCLKGTTQAQAEAYLEAEAFPWAAPMQQRCNGNATPMQ